MLNVSFVYIIEVHMYLPVMLCSMFIEMKGCSKEEAFRIGYEICEAVTAMNPKPIKLKFEKVTMIDIRTLQKCLLYNTLRFIIW